MYLSFKDYWSLRLTKDFRKKRSLIELFHSFFKIVIGHRANPNECSHSFSACFYITIHWHNVVLDKYRNGIHESHWKVRRCLTLSYRNMHAKVLRFTRMIK